MTNSKVILAMALVVAGSLVAAGVVARWEGRNHTSLPEERGVASGSPAAAGLQEGDIITAINDQTIDEDNPLTNVLWRFHVGEKVELTLFREGKEMKVEVTLQERPR